MSLSDYGIDDSIFKEPEEEEEIIWVSKSEIKRDAEDLKKLGLELVELSVSTLNTFPLETDLKDAILLAQKIKKEGRRRQLQLIGKKLRQIDVTPILDALDKLKNKHNQNVVAFHQLEQLRDQLLNNGENAFTEIIEKYPNLDRQHLRSLIRNAQKETTENKPPKSARLLFQYLKSSI
ncbi:ribosome biogenesis factor YjgA [Thorsellia kenyensis]|uniref:Dual-action ribosomal maturation protein DarP n=1 Tax=Thorsellia kenyensis TaxID=1549888 RepID=A0ABV6C8K7_9GAMM